MTFGRRRGRKWGEKEEKDRGHDSWVRAVTFGSGIQPGRSDARRMEPGRKKCMDHS